MKHISQVVQKYRQAAWRVQRQWMGLFLLGVVLAALAAAAYLNVTVRAALVGREIQNLDESNRRSLLTNAHLEIQLAQLTSVEVMRQRALALGYKPITPEEVMYVVAPGLVPPLPFTAAPVETPPEPSLMRPEYTESLIEWFGKQLMAYSTTTDEQP